MSELPPIQSFEEAYERLSQIVDQLEHGALSLEESLALYERGRALLVFCQQQIESAELRIQQIDQTDAPNFAPADPSLA